MSMLDAHPRSADDTQNHHHQANDARHSEPSSPARRATFALIATTALAPIAWGTTYIVSTEMLPAGRPLLAGLLRALPAGLALVAIARVRPTGSWWIKATVLGILNIGGFFALLFYSAFRLPGGVAATLGAVQPLIAAGLAAWLLKEPARRANVIAGLLGILGVALLVLRADAQLDTAGIVAGLAGAIAMATGIVLTKHWGRPVPLLAFTSWQLIAGGLFLLPLVLAIEGLPDTLTSTNIAGFVWLSLIGTAVGYSLWFRGIQRLPIAQVSILALLSPVVAALMGWLVLDQMLSLGQLMGLVLILGAVWLGQRSKTDDTQSNSTDVSTSTTTNSTQEITTMTKPISYQQSVTIERPADEVWTLIRDYGFDLQWRKGLTEMTPTPAGLAEIGMGVHEELHSMGSTFVSDSTVTSMDNNSYRFVGDGTSGHVEGGRSVRSLGPNTSEFTYEINLTLSGPTRFLGPVLRPILRRNLKRDLTQFRTLAEANAAKLESTEQ